ncbi:hypothetical protein EI94DRAFT_1741095 [Lactarius quietus]|nr:hypothetical protein EI94DRAFT_1741095 [Lactarius quietus]
MSASVSQLVPRVSRPAARKPAFRSTSFPTSVCALPQLLTGGIAPSLHFYSSSLFAASTGS